VGKPELPLMFDLPKAVEIELPDKTFKLGVPEEDRRDFSLKKLSVQNIDITSGMIPTDDMGVFIKLNRKTGTFSIF
jgi:hypothetical protein